MKKQSKIIIAVLAVLILAVALLAVVHFHTRETVPEGALAVHAGENVSYVEVEKLALVPVQGTVINGKGEETEVNEQGVALCDVLRAAKLDPEAVGAVTVTASDEFSAKLSGAELNEAGKAYLVPGDDGLQLIVFGDENMKRNVRDVVSVDVHR